MFKVLAFMFLPMLFSDEAYIGIGVHSTATDRPEIYLPNPIGITEADYHLNEKVDLVFKHESGIEYHEVGAGYNGMYLRVRIK